MPDKIISFINGVEIEDWFFVDGELLTPQGLYECLEKRNFTDDQANELLERIEIERHIWRKEGSPINEMKWKNFILAKYRKK